MIGYEKGKRRVKDGLPPHKWSLWENENVEEGREDKFTRGHVELDIQMLGRVLDIQQHDAQKKGLAYREQTK